MRAPLRALTFNVRYDEPSDGRHAWPNRRGLALRLIREHAADLIALQEPTAGQWADIAAALPDYTAFGRSDTDDWSDGDLPGGLFVTRRFTPLNRGVFWLSDTPTIPNSESWPHDWGARACAWVRLYDRDASRTLLFASTHFDTNAAAWVPSARVVHAELDKAAAGASIVLAGDFNCPAGAAAHRYLCVDAGYRDAWLDAGCSDDRVVTYNAFTAAVRIPDAADASPYPPDAFACGNYRIDWILVKGALDCVTASIDVRREDVLASDHYPVVAQVDWSR